MKNWIAAVAALGFMVCVAFTNRQVKTYNVNLTLDEWSKYVNWLEGTKAALKRSDLPAKDVMFINDSLLTVMQSTISQQVQKQLNDERAAQIKKDSTKPKK